MKQIIEVPHLVQFYDIEDDKWQSRSCGIVSLAMVLAYWGVKINLKELIETGLRVDGYSKQAGGWYDSGLCRIARSFGLMSFRKSWVPAKRDKEFFTSEGCTEEDLAGYEEVTLSEGIFSLKKAIDHGIPLIISIHKNWGQKNSGHLAVLNGYFESDGQIEGFYVNDPIGATYKHKNQLIKIDKFMNGWKKRAVYIRKK